MREGLFIMKSANHLKSTGVQQFVNYRLTLPIEPYPRILEAKVVPLSGTKCLTCKKAHRQVGKVHLNGKSKRFQKNCIKLISHQWKKQPLKEALRVFCLFYLERPKSVSRKQRPYPTNVPDIDNLVKNIFDAVTKSNVWEDDSQVISLSAQKKYCEGIETPRIEVIIEEVHDPLNPKLPLHLLSRD